MRHDIPDLPEGTHIVVSEDGKYLWRGTINPRENPTIMLLIIKVMSLIIGASMAIFCGIGLLNHFDLHDWLMMLTITGGVILIVIGISIIVSMLYLRALGDSYSADYLMDETGVVFRPAPEEQELNKNVAIGTALLAALAGSPGTAAASVATMNSDAASVFSHVLRVKGIRRHCCIKVGSLFLYNQIYVAPEDYDFVYHYIAAHCPRAFCSEA